MSYRREVTIGTTVLGRPIEAVHFTPPGYAKTRPPAILFGAIHGDEPVSQLMLERLADELVERPPGRDTWIIPCVNVDGLLAGSRNNANDVDLNRNFASNSWGEQRRHGYHPGAAAEDQPETQALVALIAQSGAERLIACHATYRMVNWDGRGEARRRDGRALRLPVDRRDGLSVSRLVRHEVRRRARPRGRHARVAVSDGGRSGMARVPHGAAMVRRSASVSDHRATAIV